MQDEVYFEPHQANVASKCKATVRKHLKLMFMVLSESSNQKNINVTENEDR